MVFVEHPDGGFDFLENDFPSMTKMKNYLKLYE